LATDENYAHSRPLELWGGLECTVNRIEDRFQDQFDFCRHLERLDDFERFESLGIQKIRYPVLWERVAPDSLEHLNWAPSDAALARLQQIGIEPIVGLLHHGSGPRYTDLLDPDFPEKLAAYARSVAVRYPWVKLYTPVNEPLTTARFSALYGHWYPHLRDNPSFLRATVNQLLGTVAAMQAIREVRPDAVLIQTEDMGRIHSTPELAHQRDFENERRWLSLDLLCGRFDRAHPLWDDVVSQGITEKELESFLESPFRPEIIGINHYLTSERWLDQRLELYPESTHGGNSREAYADVEAVRTPRGTDGPEAILREVWARFGVPVAVTEAHLGCTREEQMRWLWEVWNGAQRLRQEGADIRAVTVWSMLGAFDWCSLLTRCEGNYEPGVFDLRAPEPRPTALAALARQLAKGEEPSHPLLSVPGWWRRPIRQLYPEPLPAEPLDESLPPVLIVGARGTLGRAFAKLCDVRGIPYRLLSRQDLDIAEQSSVMRMLARLQPWAVINAAGYVRVPDAEREPKACFRENTKGPACLAKACSVAGIRLVTFSSDLVFDGSKDGPYVESDKPCPLNVYGRSKAQAEQMVLERDPRALVIRTSAFFGPWDEHNFVHHVRASLEAGQPFYAARDELVSPTYVPDLVQATLDLLIDEEQGIWHLANQGETSWADLARSTARLYDLDEDLVIEIDRAAGRPARSTLASERGWIMPPLDDALARYREACPARVSVETASGSRYLS
jgi:dTDP-4-dehydrorhamnose reductase